MIFRGMYNKKTRNCDSIDGKMYIFQKIKEAAESDVIDNEEFAPALKEVGQFCRALVYQGTILKEL